MTDSKRPTAARVGIALLNLLTPGLGLLRVAGLRASLGLLFAPALLVLAITIVSVVAPRPTFPVFAIVSAVTLVAGMAIWVLAIVRTWRASRVKTPAKGWSRWYGLCAMFVFALVATNLVVTAAHAVYKPFYLPMESMLPTLRANDHIFVDMRAGQHPARGDIVIFDMPALHAVYIKRVVALPGDRIAMKDGVPIINGRSATQTVVGTMASGNATARRLREVLPGEAGFHEILDFGRSELDDMPERIVPANDLFVLGDNRDRSADSRVSRAEYGVGWLPTTDVIGAPLFTYWSRDRAGIGKRLTR